MSAFANNRTAVLNVIMIFGFCVFALLIICPLIALILNVLQDIASFKVLFSYHVTKPLVLSIFTALASTAISTIAGISLAYLMEYKKIFFRETFDTLINLPFVLPPSVAGYLLLITFGKYGLVGYPLSFLGIELMFSTVAIVIAQTFVALPFIVKSTRTAMSAIPSNLINAAKTMGASESLIFKQIILPLSKKGILAGIVMAYARAIGEFGATMMVCGLLTTLPIAIYTSALSGEREVANILSLVLISISFLILAVFKKVMKND